MSGLEEVEAEAEVMEAAVEVMEEGAVGITEAEEVEVVGVATTAEVADGAAGAGRRGAGVGLTTTRRTRRPPTAGFGAVRGERRAASWPTEPVAAFGSESDQQTGQ